MRLQCTYPCVLVIISLISVGVFGAPIRPDLIVTDLWLEGDTVCFQIHNVGGEKCDGGHYIELKFNGEAVAVEYIKDTIDWGKRLNGQFEKYSYTCGGLQSTLVAIADIDKDIEESDETNNEREEQWYCDQSPPSITEGPTVSYIKVTTAQVSWKTNEKSDSTVLFGTGTRTFSMQLTDPDLVVDHSLRLTGLAPWTTYQYKVRSSDKSGNIVTSRPGYFTTLSGYDKIPPKASFTRTMTKMLPAEFRADAEDNEDVDRVVFSIDGKQFLIDYDAPFGGYMSPGYLGINHDKYVGREHTVLAEVYDSSSNMTPVQHSWATIPSCREMELAVELGTSTYLYTPEDTIDDHECTVRIVAEERREGFEEAGRARLPGPGGGVYEERWGAVEEVRIYFEGEHKETLYPGDDEQSDYEYMFHTGRLSSARDYEVEVRALSHDHCLMTRRAVMRVIKLEPEITLSREVTRDGNLFNVRIRIHNDGTSIAYLDTMHENLRGLIPIPEESTRYDATNEYTCSSRSSSLRYDLDTSVWPGSSLYVLYDAVPILYEGIEDHAIGSYCDISFHDSEDRTYTMQLLDPFNDDDEFDDAFKDSNYLLVTNPELLYSMHKEDDVDLLLNKVAELASVREGVLGFFGGSGTLHSVFDRNDRIAVGNFMHDWKDEIVITDEENDKIYMYSAAHELTIYQRLPINFPGLSSSDALIAGDLIADTDPFSTRDEFAIVEGDSSGSSRGEVTIYQYDSGTDSFSTTTNDIAYDPSEGDQVLCGDMAVTHPSNDDEIVLFNSDGRVLGYYDTGSVPQEQFASVYERGDLVAIGNLTDSRSGDEIIIGHLDDQQIYVYSASGDLLHSFACTLSSADHLDVCYEGLMVADESADSLAIWDVDESSASVINGFTRSLHGDDFVLSGRVLDRAEQQFIYARGHRADHCASGDLDIFTYSVYDGADDPEDRYDLNRLFKSDGEWAMKMADGWTGNGYLLLVGELEIIPSFACSYYLAGHGRQYIEFTDNYYTNTSGEMKEPEISAGRIVGNTINTMLAAIQMSIDIARGEQILDKSHAYVVSGGDENRFDGYREDMIDTLSDEGYGSIEDDDEVGKTTFFNHCEDRDVIYLTGHGNPHGWDSKNTWDVEKYFDPVDAAPFVYANSCQTGRYPDSPDTYGEHFIEGGASGYVGATENSMSPYGSYLAEGFFERFAPGYPAGLALKNAKRNRMGKGNYGKYMSAIYHLFGDPKLEYNATAFAAAPATSAREGIVTGFTLSGIIPGPVSHMNVAIPDMVIHSTGEFDRVRIPGGSVLAEVGEPEVCAWPVQIYFPAGFRVQDVSTVQKAEITEGTGLDLETVSAEIDGTANETKNGGESDEPWPDRDCDWSVEKSPDGGCTLTVNLYPFKYWPASTNYEFLNDFEVHVEYVETGVFINRLRTDRPLYSPGDIVAIDLYVYNGVEGQPMDVIVEGTITDLGEDDTFGLEVKRLQELSGLGLCSWQWDSTGAQGGTYRLEVCVRSTDGYLLDNEIRLFQLGILEGQISGIAVDPECFQTGQTVTISTAFENTGKDAVSGQLIIEVQDKNNNTLEMLSEMMTDIEPGKDHYFEALWNADRPRGQCRFVAYALYDGRTSELSVFPHVSAFGDGDLDDNNTINHADLMELAKRWLGGASIADISPSGGDCEVDMFDLATLADSWMNIE